MRITPKIIALLSIGLILFLILRNVLLLDLAVTKNDSLIRQAQHEVIANKNVDSVQSVAVHLLAVIRQTHKDRSNHASSHLVVMTVLLILQIILLCYMYAWRCKSEM